jgi:DNA-binding cell septation regulator SpoVG
MIGVLNYKPFQRGSILGFFDLRYHGLVIKGCRLMNGQNGYWLSFPQREGDDGNGGTKYFDQMYLSAPERDHVWRLVVAELEAQGHIQHTKQPSQPKQQRSTNGFRHPDTGEDLSDYIPPPDDDIPY